jgi:hypothetical protein
MTEADLELDFAHGSELDSFDPEAFAAADYGTPGATPLLDSSSAQIKGPANVASASFAKTYSADTPLKGIALGKGGAKIAIADTVLTNTGAKLVFVAGLERWYANPV